MLTRDNKIIRPIDHVLARDDLNEALLSSNAIVYAMNEVYVCNYSINY